RRQGSRFTPKEFISIISSATRSPNAGPATTSPRSSTGSGLRPGNSPHVGARLTGHRHAAVADDPGRRDDRISADFVALHESAFGTKRTYRDGCVFVCFRGEADERRCATSPASAADDPQRTWALSKSRSAAVFW